jgi:hypothetical protein
MFLIFIKMKSIMRAPYTNEMNVWVKYDEITLLAPQVAPTALTLFTNTIMSIS